MREISKIVIHCADTPSTMDIGVKEIRQWHVIDNGWKDIGYHYVIRRNGIVEKGREDSVVGSHVAGHNTNSIGVCLVGGRQTTTTLNKDLFTKDQFNSLANLLKDLKTTYPKASIIGHSDLDNKKTCPNFNVEDYLESRSIKNV